MGFSGFNKNTIIFFVELMMNNEKPWFDANRHRYDADAIEPAKQLVEELGAELQQFRPGIHAIPKVNKSLFRINRDVRFSTNKDPYKTNLAIMFWEGTRKRMECPGLYIHVDTGSFFWGMGLYQFTKDQMDIYRKAIANPKSGRELESIIVNLAKKGYSVGGKHYKRIPRGYGDKDNRSDLLLFNGLYVFEEGDPPDQFFSKDLIGYLKEKFESCLDLHLWILKEIN